MRRIDDNIVYAVNKAIPTRSSPTRAGVDEDEVIGNRCRDLHQQLQSAHQERESLIRHCISKSSDRLHQLRLESEAASVSGANGLAVGRKMRSEQGQLRLLQKELNVEEVIQERTANILHDKCRNYYRPATS